MYRNSAIVTFLILALGCGDSNLVDIDFLKSCHSEPETVQRNFTAKREKLTPIRIGAEHHKPLASYSIFQTEETSYIIATSPANQDFAIYDVTHGEIIKNEKLDYPPVKIGQATFKSLDSIYFQLPIKSTLIRFDSSGTVKGKTVLNDIETEWQIRGNSPGLFNDLHQAELHFIDNNRFIAALNTFGFWYYENKENIKTLGEFNLENAKLTSNFSKVASDLAKAPIELHDKYTVPYLAHDKKHIYVSYPYDHTIYKYDANTTDLMKESCLSSQYIEALGMPLELNHADQENIKFQLSNAYYGKVSYHEDLNIFSRVVFHQKELYKSDGKLNRSPCDRTYSLILFDSDLNLLSEINLKNLDVWNRALPTGSGYIVPGICQEYAGEDFFEYNIKYDLEEIKN